QFRHTLWIALGKIDFEGGAMPRLAVNLDHPLVLLDNAVDRGKPQSRPLAHRLRREERLKNVRARLLVHTLARVRYAQKDKSTRLRPDVVLTIVEIQLDIVCLNRQRPPLRHGIS